MASLVARALVDDHDSSLQREGRNRDRGVDRVMLGSFWRPATHDSAPAAVVSLASRRPPSRTPAPHG